MGNITALPDLRLSESPSDRTGSEGWDWQAQGACRRVHPEIFFHPDNERGSKRRTRDNAAKAVCATCPVLDACREHALAVREPFGVWGGLTESERERVYVARVTRVPALAAV